jgi:hypothetical protein
MAQIRVDWVPFEYGLNVIKHSLDASKDPQVHAFVLNLVMGPFETCNESLVFMGISISLKGFELKLKPMSNKVRSTILKVALTLYLP